MKTRAQWHNHTCEECLKAFDSSRYDAAYCSSTCRSKAHRAKFKKQKAIDNAKKAIDELRNYYASPDVIEVMQELCRWLTNAADVGDMVVSMRRMDVEDGLR